MIRRILSRRAFVHAGGAALAAPGLSAAVLMPAAAETPSTGVPGAASGHPDPDAALVTLGRRWQASADRCRRLRAATNAAEDRMRPVLAPEALFRRSDTDGAWITAFLGAAPWGGRLCYTDASLVERLRWTPCPPSYAKRRAEILAAFDAWQEAIDLEEDACGYTRAFAEDSAAHEENTALRAAILSTPAATMAGIAVKVRVALWCHGSIEDLDADLAERRAAGSGAMATAEAAILLDLARILPTEERPT